ncbi:MAG: histidine kinase [Spirochaetaceae bacterium]|jgi:signal transduction histidine kinase|nr:histidine kinase [Spirochaetaceae bacterium]
MKIKDYFYKTGPAISAALFLISAGVVFTIKYVYLRTDILPLFNSGETLNRQLFYINFYVPLGICALALYGCLFFSGFYIRGLCLAAGFAAAVIAGYVLDDLLTVNLCIFSAYVSVAAAAFEPPKNYCISGTAIALFLFTLYHPKFLGYSAGSLPFFVPEASSVIVTAVYLFCLALGMASIRFLTNKYLNGEAAVAHLNSVGAKMLLFNHRLQEYVRSFGEEAVKKDRLRFTSELHDSCGYVFTNIIAVTDAAMSFPNPEIGKMRDTLHLIQGQAREGLQQTRRTLHMIRELQDPVSGSIDTIYEMKTIFEEVTGIKVEIESGNMRHDYGRTVNTVLTRIVQESFTNSIRHGQASLIVIQFWEFPGYLTMTVSDNGIGARHIVKGIGLAGMEERLATVGGTMDIVSPEDGGFRLKIAIPLIHMDMEVEQTTVESNGVLNAGT